MKTSIFTQLEVLDINSRKTKRVLVINRIIYMLVAINFSEKVHLHITLSNLAHLCDCCFY
jgi:hypothetical protein